VEVKRKLGVIGLYVLIGIGFSFFDPGPGPGNQHHVQIVTACRSALR